MPVEVFLLIGGSVAFVLLPWVLILGGAWLATKVRRRNSTLGGQ